MIVWKIFPLSRPPPPNRSSADISIVHNAKKLYSNIYKIGNKLTKRDKLGIHTHLEKITLETLRDIISAALLSKIKKLEALERANLSLEVLKHLVRLEKDLGIIEEKMYVRTELLVIETSKMTNGWIKYLKTQSPAKQQSFM